MNYLFTENGFADYQYWQSQDRKTLKRINLLLKEIARNPHSGTGKPEALRGDLSGCWSRRINAKDRLVYKIDGSQIIVLSCRFHYGDH